MPTWCPFRLQFYCNGHGWLARRLTGAGIGFTLADNAFVRIDDWGRAQAFADALEPKQSHQVLDGYAELCCPVLETFNQRYHWSLMQVEYALDLVFRSAKTLKPLYEQLSRQAVLSVKAEHVASFLGKKITPQLAQEIGSRFETRIEGTCIKHRLGKAQVKMYDKHHLVLRIETTVNDVSFFKHHRKVEHRQGPSSRQLAPVKKSIYSLIDLGEILLGCCRRYLQYLSALDDHSAGVRALDRLSEDRRDEDRRDEDRLIKGLNFFKSSEQALLRALQAPQFNIRGVRRADLPASYWNAAGFVGIRIFGRHPRLSRPCRWRRNSRIFACRSCGWRIFRSELQEWSRSLARSEDPGQLPIRINHAAQSVIDSSNPFRE